MRLTTLTHVVQWDTAGQERFRTITTAYYRGAMGILLVYDVTDERSFNSTRYYIPLFFPPSCMSSPDIRNWHANVGQHASEGVNKILIGNKSDWTDKRAVTEDQGRALAEELDMKFMETSAKANEGVEEAFFALARFVVLPCACTFELNCPSTVTVRLGSSTRKQNQLPRRVAHQTQMDQ